MLDHVQTGCTNLSARLSACPFVHGFSSIPKIRKLIGSDPQFADAYFNLAMAYEQAGDAARARPCWRKYLEIEPTGTWAEIAKKHL